MLVRQEFHGREYMEAMLVLICNSHALINEDGGASASHKLDDSKTFGPHIAESGWTPSPQPRTTPYLIHFEGQVATGWTRQ